MALDPRIAGPLAAVRRRLRLLSAARGAVNFALAGSLVALVGVYGWRLGWLTPGRLVTLLALSAAASLLGALHGALENISAERAARRIDDAHELDDRFVSALFFSQEAAPTPFMRAAIEDAAARAQIVEPARAAPFTRPPRLGALGALTLFAGLIALLHFPARAHVGRPDPTSVAHLTIEHDLLEPELEAARALVREADPETKELAAHLEELLARLDHGELDRKQVFDQLAELENRLKPGSGGTLEELTQKLRKAGAELSKEKLTRETGAALAKDDLEKAKKELEKLAAEAERLASEKQSDVEKRAELARALERAARPQPSPEERRRAEEEKRLREEERRLRRELTERPHDEELKRRLERNRRELERLEKEKQERAERERQLKRLQRELNEAAEQLRQKLSPEAAEALRRAARELGKMESEIRKLGNLAKARVQIAELKELLRRAGSVQAQNGQEQHGKGQNGQNGKDGKSLLRDFTERAGQEGPKTLLLGAGGNSPVLLPLPMGPGDPPGENGQNGAREKGPSDGIGDQHDPNLMGDPTRLAAKHQATRVQGKDAAGPSRSETILGSADHGFASRAYRRVYSDYTSVVEEVMSKERVPPGYRYYVKRYFQLIRPRE